MSHISTAVGSFADFRRGLDSPDSDRLNLAPGTSFTAQNDLNRLEVTAANGIQDELSGLSNQVARLGRIEDRVGESEAVKKASATALRASRLDEEQFERATRGFDLSDRQKRSASSRLGLARSLNRARAAGATRRRFTDESKAASRAGGFFSDALLGQRVSAETGIAQAFAAKKAANDQRKANKKSALIGGIGQIAGIGLSFLSSEKLKDKQGAPVNLLSKLKKVRVEKWNYKGADRRHIGPFAEEFNDTFEVNQDNRGMIDVIDALGVTLGAVKELDRKVEAHGR